MAAHPLINQWLGMLVIMLAAALMFGALRLWQVRRDPGPEIVRKVFHISGGLVGLSLPWLFGNPWPVVMLMAGLVVAFLGLRYVRSLKSGLGRVLHSVDRQSLGEIHFPISIAAIFVLAHGDAVLYLIPVLVLTFSDSLAALIGVQYGHIRYTTSEGWKSAEGSTAFFIATFFCVHTPLLLMTSVGRAQTLVIAVILALLVMLLEGIAWDGVDNLLVPLVTFILLRAFLATGLNALLVDLAITVVMTVFVFAWRGRTTLNDSALMGAVLAGFMFWALGGPLWAVPPILLLITYVTLAPPNERGIHPHTFAGVLSVASTGIFWLVVSRYVSSADLYYPFTLAFACHLTMIGLAWQRRSESPGQTVDQLVRMVGRSWLLILTPFVLLDGLRLTTLIYAAVAIPAMAMAGFAFYLTRRGLDDYGNGRDRWWQQAACAMAGSSVGLAAVFAL